MTEPARQANWLRGQRVTFTGRLACLTRAQAAELVAAHGGRLVSVVSPRTAFVVMGQEGWPLRKDGRLSRKLEQARRLQREGAPLAILTEEEFLGRLGLASRTDGVRRLYTAAELTRLLRISRDRLRAWMQAGLIQPAKAEGDVVYFDFRQVSGAKTLSALAAAGATKERLLRSLRQLRAWMPEVEQPLARLALSGPGGELLVRLENGQLAEPSGQLVFDFEAADGAAPAAALICTEPAKAAGWFSLGWEHEQAGRLLEAVRAYRQALDVGGPDGETCFNLGNTLYRLGDKTGARACLLQAVALQPESAEAWNNLGTILEELRRWEESQAAYAKALAVDPGYGDAHYNLADLLEKMGRADEAVPHWRAYVQQDAGSEWGRHARRRLSAKEQGRRPG
jgi:tetratricopeptide (TPR) repeat protein